MFVCWARVVGSPACSSACEHNYCYYRCCCFWCCWPFFFFFYFVPFLAALLATCIFFFSSVAVAALLKLPLVTINAGVVEAAFGAVQTLAAGNAENQAKLGAAGACEGGYPA